MNNLWRALERVTDAVFKYDVDWITGQINWPSSSSQVWGVGGNVFVVWLFCKFQTHAEARWMLQNFAGNSGRPGEFLVFFGASN